ncbi:MAG: hypothetical protein H7Z14_19420 [Anaerolineae bacterium]|nr:hypothetical protein [Phycisphaerae bacterium]
MKRTTKNLSILSLAAASTLVATQMSYAVPVVAVYNEDQRCDPVISQTLSHELGEQQFFPLNESFNAFVSPATFTVCVPDDNIANDWIVQITNTSGIAWQNLFFVADLGLTIGNADGNMIDVIGAPGVTTDAFRIDGTVTLGLNNNLLNESGAVDEIFAPGETWRFNVSNYFDAAGTAPAPAFRIPGKFAGSEPYVVPPFSTASIVATPVPEPSALFAIVLPAAALLMRRRSRR